MKTAAPLRRDARVAIAAWVAALCLFSALLPRPASAHPEAARVIREIVRLQGYFGAVPPGSPVQREVTLLVLADRYSMKVTDWQVFATSEAPPGAVESNELRLQGDRARLADFAKIGSERVTILGERRPGSSEVFLLALDLCPSPPPAPR
jgi:hypothetical protein